MPVSTMGAEDNIVVVNMDAHATGYCFLAYIGVACTVYEAALMGFCKLFFS